jgi:thiamine-phosphate pyrophosphorylase
VWEVGLKDTGGQRELEISEEMGAPVAGAAVVCLKGDAVLLVQRGREPNRGRWSFPGGKIEAGETARRAAEREALEETGLRVRVLDVVDVYDAIFPPHHFCVADYLAEPVDEAIPVPQSDVADARWVPFGDVDRYELTEAMRRVLERARWLRSVRAGAPPSIGMDAASLPAGIGDRSALGGRIRGLYVITDDRLVPGRSHVEIARAALEGGAGIVQLRDKRRDAGELLPIAREIRGMCRAAGALFLVNDRVDLAAASGADGVHLGQTDLPVREARELLGPEKLIGISVENAGQTAAAEDEGADYLGVGAIYGSGTKADAGAAVGPGQIARLRRVSSLPIVAIGGITLERIPEVRAAGADAVAVISSVAAAPDPAAAARTLVQVLGVGC